MQRVYECEASKKAEVMKILEAEPYADDSFARVGYKVKDGESVDEEKGKFYIYISASEEFCKKADEKLKDLASVMKEEDAKRIAEKIIKEEEAAQSGFGDMFG
jgi:hypothetical protein